MPFLKTLFVLFPVIAFGSTEVVSPCNNPIFLLSFFRKALKVLERTNDLVPEYQMTSTKDEIISGLNGSGCDDFNIRYFNDEERTSRDTPVETFEPQTVTAVKALYDAITSVGGGKIDSVYGDGLRGGLWLEGDERFPEAYDMDAFTLAEYRKYALALKKEILFYTKENRMSKYGVARARETVENLIGLLKNNHGLFKVKMAKYLRTGVEDAVGALSALEDLTQRERLPLVMAGARTILDALFESQRSWGLGGSAKTGEKEEVGTNTTEESDIADEDPSSRNSPVDFHNSGDVQLRTSSVAKHNGLHVDPSTALASPDIFYSPRSKRFLLSEFRSVQGHTYVKDLENLLQWIRSYVNDARECPPKQKGMFSFRTYSAIQVDISCKVDAKRITKLNENLDAFGQAISVLPDQGDLTVLSSMPRDLYESLAAYIVAGEANVKNRLVWAKSGKKEEAGVGGYFRSLANSILT